MATEEPPDGSSRWRPRRGWWIAAGLLALLLVAVGLAVLWVRAPTLYGTGDAAKTAAATTRGAILTVAAALIAATAAGAGLYMTARTLAETQRANRASDEREREAQVTDRYTKAIEQLGSAQLDVRLGGVYALERIAVDSERDHPTVVEVLGAFVRGHSASRYQYIQAGRPGWQGSTDEDEEQRLADRYVAGLHRPPVDVQAAVSVLGRLPSRPEVPRGDLTRAHLAGAHLFKANLTGALLFEADLIGVQLGRADLTSAQLFLVTFASADLTEANLTGAHLSMARLTAADLVGADLTAADLTEANLTGAHLFGADLSAAKNLSQQQLDSARGDDETKLPAGLQRPAHWSAKPAAPPPADQ